MTIPLSDINDKKDRIILWDLEVNSTSPHDPVDICILKLIWENVSFVNPFTFLEIT